MKNLKSIVRGAGLITAFSLLVGFWQPARSADAVQVVLVHRSLAGKLPANLTILEDYGEFAMAEVEETALPELEAGYVVERLPARTQITLPTIQFDSQAGEPDVPAALRAAASDPYFLIQFYGPIKPEWLANLESLGVTFVAYHPSFTYIARFDPTLLAQVESAQAVQWVGHYHPAYRIGDTTALAARADRDLDGRAGIEISFAPDVALSQEGLLAEAQAAGAVVEKSAPGTARLWVYPDQLATLAAASDVLMISPYVAPRLDNDNAVQVMDTWNVWRADRNGFSLDLMGAGQVAGVVDSGVDSNNTTPDHADFYDYTNNVTTSRILDSAGGDGCSDLACTCYTSDDTDSTGHGTHVAGSIVGNGYSSLLQLGLQSQARSSNPFFDYAFGVGQAPEAGLVVAHVAGQNALQPGTLCGLGITLNTWSNVYAAGARVTNNSWGTSLTDYAGDSLSADQHMWTYQDSLLVTSAGNAGPEPITVGQPGTGKNLLTVGASGNHNPAWTGTSDTATVLTDFSSRGPVSLVASDGRFKPDIVAPGADILSTRTTYIPNTTNPLWMNEPGDGDGNGVQDYTWSGGTSMASPQITGAAIIVRDYLQDIQGLGSTTPPSAAILKAMLINGATDMGYGYEALTSIPGGGTYYGGRNLQGWGMANIQQSIAPDAPRAFFFDDFTDITNAVHQSTIGMDSSGDYVQYTVNVSDASEPLKISLTWTDVQRGSDSFAVNNLDLLVTAPDGTTTYRGNVFSGSWSTTGGSADARNNTEAVYLQSPATGTWTIRVTATTIAYGTQPYALVVSGGLGITPAYTRACSGVAGDSCTGRMGNSALAYRPSLKPLQVMPESVPANSYFATQVRLTNWSSNSDTISLSTSLSTITGAAATGVTVTFLPEGPYMLASGESVDIQVLAAVDAAPSANNIDLAITATSAGAGTPRDMQVIPINIANEASLLNEMPAVSSAGAQYAPQTWALGQDIWTAYLSSDTHDNKEARLMATHSADGGQSWTDMGQVDDNSGHYIGALAIAGSADASSVTVVWLNADGSAVYARTWTSGGGWAATQALASYTVGTHFTGYPAVIYDNDSDILAVWWDYTTSSSSSRIYSRVYSGGTWGTTTTVPNTNTGVHYMPSLALDSSRNRVWMAYSRNYSSPDRDIYIKLFNGATNNWSGAGSNNLVVSQLADREVFPQVYYSAATDRLWVAWVLYPDWANPTPRLHYATSPAGTISFASFGPYATRISGVMRPGITGDATTTYIAYNAITDGQRGNNLYLLEVAAAGGTPSATQQVSAGTDDGVLTASGNAGAYNLFWATTTVNGHASSGPTLVYAKNPPNNDYANYTTGLGTAQTLFNLAENFDLYLAQFNLAEAAQARPMDTYADLQAICGYNTPCYLAPQTAYDAAYLGGTGHLYPNMYNSGLDLNRVVVAAAEGSLTLTDLAFNGGTFLAPAGELTLTGNMTYNSGTFTHNDGTVTFGGSVPQSISGGPLSFYNLVVASGASLSLPHGSTQPTAANSVTNNGTLIQTAATAQSATTEFLHLTDGASTNRYHGVDLTPTSSTPPDFTVTISRRPGGCTSNALDPLITRCFRIEPAGGAPATVTLRMWFTEAERNGQAANNLVLWDYQAPNWVQVGANFSFSESGLACTSEGGLGCWVEAEGINTFSPFGAGEDAPIPTVIQLSRASARSSSSNWPLAAGSILMLALGVAFFLKQRKAG